MILSRVCLLVEASSTDACPCKSPVPALRSPRYLRMTAHGSTLLYFAATPFPAWPLSLLAAGRTDGSGKKSVLLPRCSTRYELYTQYVLLSSALTISAELQSKMTSSILMTAVTGPRAAPELRPNGPRRRFYETQGPLAIEGRQLICAGD